MSEYTPITDELRERIGQAEHIFPLSGDSKETQVRINLAWLTEKLDAIDSIHAQLERENAALKAELDRVLGEDERDGWMWLPKDADGVPIRLGDELVDTSDTFHCGKAHVIELKEDGWIVFVGSLGRRPHVYRHVKTDTWERIIEDAFNAAIQGADERWDSDVDRDILVARCKALCERTKEDA